LSATRQFASGPFSSVEFGVNFSSREKTKDSIESFIDLDCPGATPNNQCTAAIPSALLGAPTALSFLGIPGMVSYNPLGALATPGLYVRRPNSNADVISKRWGVEEDVLVYYAQVNLDTEFGGVPLTGNFGVQIVDTDQSSTGGVRGPSGAVTVEQGDSYVEVLPSVNLTFQVGEDTYLRVGAARTLARPRMDEMRASFEVGYNIAQVANANPTSPSNSYWGGGGGNPLLRPWIANAFDISFEHFFGDTGGYIALAGFYKDLESYVYPETIPYDFTGFPAHASGVTPATFRGFATAPQNGSGGHIQGLELTANIPAELIAASLEGFGLVFNASATDSSIEPPNTPGNALPGLSETVINTTLYYERAGFEARISNRYRSDFLGEVTGFGAGRELRFVNGESLLDAQLGYRFSQGSLEGLSVQLQAYNLTNEPFSGYANNDERLVRDYQTYGTTYLLGLSYRR
jgi:iron complex outermembrane receptor protein